MTKEELAKLPLEELKECFFYLKVVNFFILVGNNSNTHTITKMAHKVNLTFSYSMRLLSQFEKAGLIIRDRTGAKDKRMANIILTRKGEIIKNKFIETLNKFN